MEEYITRRAALEAIPRNLAGGLALARIIDKIPKVEAVPVVRCVQCLHWRESDGFCGVHMGYCGGPLFFCAAGRKK